MSAQGLIDQLVQAQPPAVGEPKPSTAVAIGKLLVFGALAWGGGHAAKWLWEKAADYFTSETEETEDMKPSEEDEPDPEDDETETEESEPDEDGDDEEE